MRSGISYVLVRLSSHSQLHRLQIVLQCMRRISPLLAALLVLSMASTAYAAHGGHKPASTCRLPRQSRMLVADTQAQVYEKLETEAQAQGIFGCAYGHRRSYYLGAPLPNVGTSSGIVGIRLETLSGAMVAYEYGVAGPSGSYQSVIVRNLSNGRMRKLVTGAAIHPEPGFHGIGPARAIVVKSDGAVAWIVETNSTPSREYAVEAVDSTGTRLLAESAGINPSSLALTGSTLYWTQSGKPISTVLH